MQHKDQRDAIPLQVSIGLYRADEQQSTGLIHNTSNNRATKGLSSLNNGGPLQPESAFSPEQEQKHEHLAGQTTY